MLVSYFKKFSHQLKISISRCELCGLNCSDFNLLCNHCHADLPQFNHALIKGELLHWPAIHKLINPIKFDSLICLAPYDWPFNTWISQCKYRQRFELSSLMAQLLAQHWKQMCDNYDHESPDLVVAVPSHFKRWQERGFNQAHLIAKKFAKKTSLPYQKNALVRLLDTEKQVGKTGSQRRKNIKGAISINHFVLPAPKHVLLIDDVITTGSTANEIATVLKSEGVHKVTVMTLCIALPKDI